MLAESFLRKKNNTHLDRGRTLDTRKSDRETIQDGSTLVPPKPPPLDEPFILRCVTEILNAIHSKAEGEAKVSDHHEQLFDAAVQHGIHTAKADESALHVHQQMSEAEEKDLLERREGVQKSIARTKTINSMDWNALECTKFIALCIGSGIATIFGIINIFRILQTNNLSYLDSNPFAILLVSLVFVTPILSIKQKYDTLKNPKAKDRYVHRVYLCMIGSFIFFVLVFCLVNLPMPQTTDLFAETPTSFTDSRLVSYLNLLSQIILECVTASLLMIYATREYENHVIVTDTQKINTVTRQYDSLTQELQEIRRGKILISRRLEMLPTYFKQVEIQRKIYVTKAVTALQNQLRRKP